MSGRVVMKLFDRDPLKDEIVGSLLFNLKECLLPENNGKFLWRNVYGAPIGHSGDVTDLMNANPEAASTWKGRLLVQVVSEQTEKPTCIKKKIDQKTLEIAQGFETNREFDIIAEVCSAIALPEHEKYRVVIQIADYRLVTEKPKQCVNTYNRWTQRFP